MLYNNLILQLSYAEVINISNEQKTALVLPSGAMMGSYQCGVLKAFRENNLAPDFYLQERNAQDLLPWDFLDIGVSKASLAAEFNAAKKP